MAERIIDKNKLNNMMQAAWGMASESPCLKKRVGSVLYEVTFGIIGTGFGGPTVPCTECVRKTYEWQQDGCWSIHSEYRAIYDCLDVMRYRPHDLKCLGPNLVMFVTHGPCDQCLKAMDFFNIRHCVFDTDYHNDYSKWDGRIKVYKLEDLNELVIP